MAEQKQMHTAGPWLRDGLTIYALDETGRVNRFSLRMEGGYVFRSFSRESTGDTTTGEELEANARLIAAAPDMLATLQWVRANYASGSTAEINERIDTVVRRATGAEG